MPLISSLTDGTYDSNEYSQEALTVAKLITSHASRSRRKRVLDFFSEVPDKLVDTRKIERPQFCCTPLKNIYDSSNINEVIKTI